MAEARSSCAVTTSGCSPSPAPEGSERRGSRTRSLRRRQTTSLTASSLVPLQSVRDPGHVIGTIARSLGLFDGEGDLEQRLVAHIEGRRLLLVLDNFEQVVDAAPSLAAIVAASPDLKVAVTSRTRLRVRGEQELPLDPLAREAAVSLFLERARAVRPDFRPDEARPRCDRGDLRPRSTACRSRSSWPRRASSCCPDRDARAAWSAVSSSSPRARAMRRRGIERCATRSAGASSSSTTTRRRSFAASPSSSGAARSRR